MLFKGRLTDFLLCVAEQGVFDPAWSDEIHAEWTRNLHTKRIMPWEKIVWRRSEMDRAFPAANWRADAGVRDAALARCTSEAERKDAHVVATAVQAEATWIVTDNVLDFPPGLLESYALRAVRPNAFCQELFAANPSGVVAGAAAHRVSMSRPAYSQEGYLALLGSPQLGLPDVARLLAVHRDGL